MSREPVTIYWTKSQLKVLQPLFDEILEAAKIVPVNLRSTKCDGLLGQVYTYGMQVRYIKNKEVMATQKINRAAQGKVK